MIRVDIGVKRCNAGSVRSHLSASYLEMFTPMLPAGSALPIPGLVAADVAFGGDSQDDTAFFFGPLLDSGAHSL